MTIRRDGLYPAYWPEQAEHTVDYEMAVPPWHRLEAESHEIRQTMLDRRARGKPLPPLGLNLADRHSFGTIYAPYPPERFTARNVFCFQLLPSIHAIKEAAAQTIDQAVAMQRQRLDTRQFSDELDAWSLPADARQVDDLKEQVRSEMAHSLYHHANWRHDGRHVYVLDRTTYTLLANTPLPDLPASILSAPFHSFYLVLPPDAFTFGVWNARTQVIDQQPIEGVLVTMDNITPDSPNERELAFMAIGQGESVSDRNLAFISLALGADAILSKVQMPGAGRIVTEPYALDPTREVRSYAASESEDREGWKDGANGGHEIGVLIPRVIIGLLLYLASEHPDIEPIPPAPRRKFADIRSPKQRQAALDNQAKKLKGATRLPILYIGRHLHEEIEAERERVQAAIDEDGGRTYTLDHPVWVRGHWRQQPFGPGRLERRLIWIRPYQKGPDMAASMKVQAAKVQRAQPAGFE